MINECRLYSINNHSFLFNKKKKKRFERKKKKMNSTNSTMDFIYLFFYSIHLLRKKLERAVL